MCVEVNQGLCCQVPLIYLQFQLAETLGKEFVMTLDEASMKNYILPKGCAFVPPECLSNDKQSKLDVHEKWNIIGRLLNHKLVLFPHIELIFAISGALLLELSYMDIHVECKMFLEKWLWSLLWQKVAFCCVMEGILC